MIKVNRSMGKKTHFSRGNSRGVQYGLQKVSHSFFGSSDIRSGSQTQTGEQKAGSFKNSHRVAGGFFINILKHLFPPFL
mgnify:CR=1 FL=1